MEQIKTVLCSNMKSYALRSQKSDNPTSLQIIDYQHSMTAQQIGQEVRCLGVPFLVIVGIHSCTPTPILVLLIVSGLCIWGRLRILSKRITVAVADTSSGLLQESLYHQQIQGVISSSSSSLFRYIPRGRPVRCQAHYLHHAHGARFSI